MPETIPTRAARHIRELFKMLGPQPTPDPDPLLAPREVAQLAGVTARAVYGWVARGVLPKSKIGGGLRWRRSFIQRFLEGVDHA